MSPYKLSLLAGGVAAVCLAATVSKFAIAATEQGKLGGLGVNEGIFVDPATFNVVKGVAKSDPSAQIVRLGAREVKSGAIIFRAGDKLYLADADPGCEKLDE